MTAETFKNEAHRIRHVLVQLSCQILHDTEEAEDVVQDTLLRLWLMREQIRMPVEPLARVLTRNRCLDILRRRKPSVDLTADLLSDDEQQLRDSIERMMRAVETLPDMQQVILRLRHMEGMDFQQIASITGTTQAAVRKALSRARQAVRDKFRQYEE